MPAPDETEMVDDVLHALTPDTPDISDGRHRRRMNNKRRLFQAFLTLIHEGSVSPTAHDLSKRADIGLRSVFRHYPEMEGLYQEMAQHVLHAVQQAFATQVDIPDWRERLSDLARRRSQLYDAIAPYQVAIEVHRHESRPLQVHQQLLAELERESVRQVFADAVERHESLVHALDLLLSFHGWLRLRRDARLSHGAALAVVVQGGHALLADVTAFSD